MFHGVFTTRFTVMRAVVFRPSSDIKPLAVPLTQHLTAERQTPGQPLRWLAVGEGGESNFSTQAAPSPQFPEHSSKLDFTRTQASALLRRRVSALRFSPFVPRLPPPCCLRPIRCKERLTRRQHPAAPPAAPGGTLDGAKKAFGDVCHLQPFPLGAGAVGPGGPTTSAAGFPPRPSSGRR